MTELQYRMVSQLAQAGDISSNDFLLLSQLDENGQQYISRCIRYSKLCASMLADFDDKMSASIHDALSSLTTSVDFNNSRISALSGNLSETTSAVIKMANCIQKNKMDISAVSSEIDVLKPLLDMDIEGYDGLSVSRREGRYIWEIRHFDHVTSVESAQFVKVKYNESGHVVEAVPVVSTDIAGLGSFLTKTGIGLSSDDHIVSIKPASASELGGIRPGDNVSVSEDGVLSAVDTKYTAGYGLSMSGCEFQLKAATTRSLGGVMVGANLSIHEDGTLDAQYIGPATDQVAGIVRLGFIPEAELSDRQYAVHTDVNGNAFVEVNWSDKLPTFISNEYSTDMYETISSVAQANGNIVAVGRSTALYGLIRDLSSDLSAMPSLSSCLRTTNTRITYDENDGQLAIAGGDGVPSAFYQTEIPTIVGGYAQMSGYVVSGESELVSADGPFIRLVRNTSEQPEEDIYIDMRELSAPKYQTETWTFTLSGGEIVEKNILIAD